MAGIFISYRRSDSTGSTGRLTSELKARFPDSAIFRDINSIEAGANFIEAIDTAIQSCAVLLAVMGPRWLSVTGDTGGRRIDDSKDLVRLEIGAALQRGVRVIPILVEGATMPPAHELPEDIRALASRHAHELSDSRWDHDVDQLVGVLEKVPGIRRKRPMAPGPRPSTPRGLIENASATIVLTVVMWVAFSLLGLPLDQPGHLLVVLSICATMVWLVRWLWALIRKKAVR